MKGGHVGDASGRAAGKYLLYAWDVVVKNPSEGS